ncbi:MAG: hypothetical protein ACI4TD_02140 [Phocaeicola sp.]
MATKTFEELKQMAIQIRDEKTNKQNTATRIGTQMLEHLNKLEQDYYDKTTLDKRTTEINISNLYPTNGVGGTNKYTLAGAIAQVSSEYRTIQGLKITFVNNETNKSETWVYNGGIFTTIDNWVLSNDSEKLYKLQANMLPPIKGKNFFNKQDVTSRVEGLLSESGSIGSSTQWVTFICQVNPQKNYIVNGSNIRVAFFKSDTFISYTTGSNKFSTPENCNIAKICVYKTLLQDEDNFIVNEGGTLDLTSTYWETYVVKEQIDEVESKIDEHINSVAIYEYNRINQSSVLKENYILNKETGGFESQEGSYSMSIPLYGIDIVRIIGFQFSFQLYYVLVKDGAVLPSITITKGNDIDISVTGCSEIRICSSIPSRFKEVVGAILTLKEVQISEAMENKVDKKLGKNIFNCNSSLNVAGWCYDGKTINSILGAYKANGQINETRFFTSYYIPVKPNTKYTTTFKIGSDNSFIHLYDKTKSNKTRTINDQSTSFTTAENEYFIRISARNILYKLSIEEGDTATENTPYEDYVLLSKKEYDDFVYKSSILSGLKIVAHLADWEGKNVAGYGDSITELQGESEDGVATSGWLKTVGDYFGFNKRYNRGIGGTTIRNYNKEITVKVNPNGGNKNYGVPDEQKVTCCQAMCSWSRIKAQFPEEIKDTIDLVLFMGGTNDFGGVGDIGDGILPKWSSENDYDDEWMADSVYNPEHGDFPQNTFKGSIASTILKLQRWMPYARIVLVTQLSGKRETVEDGMTDFCYDSHGKSPYDYTRDAIMVAEMMSTPYIDLFGTCGINQFNSTLFIGDKVHPNTSNSNGKRNGVSSLARSIIGGLKNVLPYSRTENDNNTYVD